ncbi:hypothetical protein AU074_26365 [Pseudomonas sp. ATCC PTA-122608]|uniref:hypothetical protein n=1 Tax=unclassified Pseudomonas TaxID=196821 RepID=UPI00096B7B9E|nr:hypothetical protein [Pseudomonas sp. ATCC PTA-122608]NIL20614.1 hypothetical protein [Pseudomonas sp. AN3A02]OLY74474.1 hypothetical protein AU074_26365 [Pseudomonas sp. ATCC PTA-122608]
MSVIDNPYAPPQAELSQPLAAASTFFVVAPRKLVIMILLTSGMYFVYWFYKQWTCYRQATGANVWPVVRAFFSVIFLYPLIMKIRRQVEVKAPTYQWQPRSVAIGLVVCGALPYMYSWALAPLTAMKISACLTIVHLYLMVQVQRAVNQVENDLRGEVNKRLTLANCIWIAIGLCFYALSIVSAMRLAELARG